MNTTCSLPQFVCPKCGGKKDNRSKECRSCHDPFLTEKQCTKCKQTKPISEFRIRTRKTPRPRPSCKACEAENQRRYFQTIPAKVRNERKRSWERRNQERHQQTVLRRRVKTLGLESEMDQILELLERQISCQICGSHPSGRTKRLHIDHNHTTGRFRGLLCGRCNLTIGKFNDNPSLLRAAANYLEKFVDKIDVSMP
jgi:hypothetical protein